MNRPELTEVLDESEFFERERTDRQIVELAILLYNFGVRFRKVARILGWIGVERSDVAVWNWVQKFGQRLSECGRRPAADLPAILLIDETAIKQPVSNRSSSSSLRCRTGYFSRPTMLGSAGFSCTKASLTY
jgi:hypothetical protein